jgi:hypothetical protein
VRSDLGLARAVIVALALAGCVSLPMPFEPGSTPSPAPVSLIRPPPARIVIPPPASAGLGADRAQRFAAELASALQELEVPATAAGIRNPEYRLLVNGEAEAGLVRLTYSLTGRDGRQIAATGGPRPVPARAWAEAAPETLRAVASDAAPAILRMLGAVEASAREQAPGAAARRLPSATLPAIVGAPGDGARSLDRALRAALEREGVVVAPEGAEAEFRIAGRVARAPAGRARERVEIVWTVFRADGLELGRVAQLNEVPRGALDGLWGDVAVIVADQAAQGVVEVIRRHRDGD